MENNFDTSFLEPHNVDWRPPHIWLDLYESVDASTPIKINVMDWILANPNKGLCLNMRHVSDCMRICVYVHIPKLTCVHELFQDKRLFFGAEVHDSYEIEDASGKKKKFRPIFTTSSIERLALRTDMNCVYLGMTRSYLVDV